MTSKPNVLILGGLNTCSRAIASFLVPLDGEPLVSNLRIVDKFLVQPPTIYIGSEFPKILEKPNVEYKQLNLSNADAVKNAFDPPEGQEPYSYVFDLTGEIAWDRSEQIQITKTFGVARLCGLEAARRKVKAYVRSTGPYYNSKEKGKNTEKEDLKPDDILGTWWHETLRMLASIEDLNLVIVRQAMVYGPYMDFGGVMKYLAIAQTYSYLKKPLLLLHGPGQYAAHTVHVEDVAGSMWACAEWMSKLGRADADKVAGEEFVFHNDKSKVKEIEGVVAHDKKCIAPLFNIEDDNNTTMASLGTATTGYFGGTIGFHNAIVNAAVRFEFTSVIEEINGEHINAWEEIKNKSNPPLESKYSMWFHCYLDASMLKRTVLAFNADKIKNTVGYQLRRPNLTNENIKEIITKLQEERSWPVFETPA